MANATFADIQKEVDEMSKSIEKGTKRGELEAERANISADIADTEKEKNKIAMAGLGPLEKRITLASSEVAITKSMLAYQDQIGMGIAPSMKMRMQGIQQQGDAIAAQEAYIEKLKTADISEQERQLKLNEAYAKRNAMLGEQLEMSKSLREGWVSALSAQSMFSGRALKIAMTKESNLGTAISGAVNAHISSMTGTNQSGQGARRSSGFEVDASGRQSFRDEGNAYYKQDYRGGGGEIDMEEAKKLSDMALRKDLMKAAEQAKKVYGGVQDMVMTGKATALLGGGSLGASAEYGPNNPRRAAHGEVIPEEKAPPVVPPAGPTSKGKGSGSPVTLTFNINTKAEVENLVKDITERLLTECLMT